MAKKQKQLKNVEFPSIQSRDLTDTGFLDQLQENLQNALPTLFNKSIPYEKMGERVITATLASESACTEFTSPGAVDDSGTFQNSSNVLAHDGQEAYAANGGAVIVDQFGFDIPAGATITSVQVQLVWRRTVSPGITGTGSARISKDGGSTFGTLYQTSTMGISTLGSATMGLSLSAAEVNDDNNFQVIAGVSTNGTGYIDSVKCEVCYEGTGDTTTITTNNVATMPVTATAGSVMFAETGSDPYLQEDNDNLFWDDTNNRLGVGTNSPDRSLHVADSGAIIENGVAVTESPSGVGLILGATDATNEGGEFQLQAPGGSYTTAFRVDNYQNTLRFKTDVNAGGSGSVFATFDSTHLTMNRALVVNEDAQDRDTRIEGQSDPNCFYLDASTNRIGIGTATPAVKLDIDSNSNTQALRLRGADGTNELFDMYVGANGQLILDLRNSLDPSPVFNFYPKHASYGILLRDSAGVNGAIWANFYLTDAADDWLSINVNSVKDADAFVVTESNRIGLGEIPTTAKLHIVDSASVPPINITERSSVPSAPGTDDIYLDDGTNTLHSNPGLRRYTGSAWEDVGGGGAKDAIKWAILL